jgi:superfamily II DNA or RNA helicase
MNFKQKLLDLIVGKSILEHIDEVEQLRETVPTEEIEDFVNFVRAIVQKEAVVAVQNNGGSGLVVMATGSGKSKVAIDLADVCKEEGPMTVIVPTEKLRDNGWFDEIALWSSKETSSRFKNFCYASISKVKGNSIALAVLDECHNITPANATFFLQNDVKNIIALTATVPKDLEKRELLSSLGLNLVYEVTLDQAVRLGFVAPYKITVIYSQLDNVNKNIRGGSKDKPFFTTEASTYNYLCNKLDGLPPGSKAAQLSILARMRFIYNLPSKMKVAQFLLEKVISPLDRTLIFCGTVGVADQLCEHSFHSKSKGNSYDLFKNMEINRLSCVKSINEGHSFPNLDVGVIQQLTSNDKDLVQRIGRLIRYRPGHTAHLYILVANGTQDLSWASKALEKFNQNVIEHITFEKFVNLYTQ